MNISLHSEAYLYLKTYSFDIAFPVDFSQTNPHHDFLGWEDEIHVADSNAEIDENSSLPYRYYRKYFCVFMFYFKVSSSYFCKMVVV